MSHQLKIAVGAALALLCGAAGVTAAQVNAGTESEVELAVPAPAEGFTAAILADRTTGEEAGLAVLRQAVREINLLKPTLVLHVGDLVPGYTRDMEQWERDIEPVKEILAELEAPLFPVAGNHDVITGTGNADDRRGEQLYRKHFGPLYYSFDCGSAHFICLYTDEALKSEPFIGDAQLRWLQEDLAGTAAEHVFVLMHKPMWEYDGSGWEAVHSLLKRHPVRAVIAGHFHHYYKSRLLDGVQYYVLGVTGGRTFSPELAGGLEHYCLLHVGPEGYRLALVKPGNVLPDDHILGRDYEAMAKLRSLSREETGITGAVQSPEEGPVDERVQLHVTNPLETALPVTVRGNARGGPWRFDPLARRLIVGAGERRRVSLGIRSERAGAPIVPPQVEVEYTYTDSKGRTVVVALPRRIPLRRSVAGETLRPSVDLDGHADEDAWQEAPAVSTAVWRASAFEPAEPGPTFRLLPAAAGLYLFAESPDAYISGFRSERMLSDAVFVGALNAPERYGGDLDAVPVVVILPFAAPGSPAVMKAFWDPKRPVGPEAKGVHFATRRRVEGGWVCEAFLPWDVLLADGTAPAPEMRFNVGVWDNDGELFTDIYSWAPTADLTHWGRLVLTEQSAD
jgi:hypothetical protein